MKEELKKKTEELWDLMIEKRDCPKNEAEKVKDNLQRKCFCRYDKREL